MDEGNWQWLTVQQYGDQYGFCESHVRRILEHPERYPWPQYSIADARRIGRQWRIHIMKGHTSDLVSVVTYETVLPDYPVTCYHSLGLVPQNVMVTVVDKEILGPAPAVGEATASSYVLRPLVSSGVTSGQVVRHTPIPPTIP